MIAETLAELLARGVELYRHEKYAQAESVLSEALLLDSACADAHFFLGLVLKSGLSDVPKIARARHEFATAVRLRDRWSEAWLEYGRVCSWLGDLEHAANALHRSLELDDANAEAWFLLYGFLLEHDKYDEAVNALERACALAPDCVEYVYQRERVKALVAKPRRKLGRFPVKVDDFSDLRSAMERYIMPEFRDVPPFISEESRVLTIGSCFARNIAMGLRDLGVHAHHAEQSEDIHTTYANRFFFEWLAGIESHHTGVFDRFFGKVYRERFACVLREADVVVYSLGVAAGFFDRETDEPVLTIGVNQNMALQSESIVFRTISVSENVENLTRIAELIWKASPHAMLVLTVSPVPLRASLEHNSALVADCLSKSTLRVAADEFLRKEKKRALYWPSFEAVRWMGSYTDAAFGAEDGSAFHVNQAVVTEVLRAFIRCFGTFSDSSPPISLPEQAPLEPPARAARMLGYIPRR